MVKGLDVFREFFAGYEKFFTLIGGAACDDWFSRQGLPFRATKDLDIVLIIEVLDHAFVQRFKEFINAGGYEIRQRAEGKPILYRFQKPKNGEFPAMLELFSRSPDGLEMEDDQTIVPIKAGQSAHSLSAILMNDSYYQLIHDHRNIENGLPMATPTALIPLKARAWQDLSERKKAGEDVDDKDITKHRTDVFRLAGTLPGESGPDVPEDIKTDLARFIQAFPVKSVEWRAILDSLKTTFAGKLDPAALISAITTYFRL
jgi:hypothetical protein